MRAKARREPLRRLADTRTQRKDLAFQPAPAHLVARHPGQQLVADQAQEALGRIGPAGALAARFGKVGADAALPARRRQRARRLQRGVQRRLQRRAGGNQFLQSPAQAAGARAPAFRAQQPAAHLGGLQAGQLG